MKKFLLFVCIISVFPTFGLEKNLSVWDLFTRYFSEIFPNYSSDIESVQLNYIGVGSRPDLKKALQKAVYYDLLPNNPVTIYPDRLITDKEFSRMIRDHFGIQTQNLDDSYLTLTDYERFMSSVRTTILYKLFQSIENIPSSNTSYNVTQLDNFGVLEWVYTLLRQNYFWEMPSDSSLVYGAVEWLVYELGDEYTEFFRPEYAQDFLNLLEGNIVGIWVFLDINEYEQLVISDVISGGPAEKAGILPGDIIQKIDGIEVNMSDGINDELSLIRWPEKSTVNITVLSGSLIKTFSIEREVVETTTIETLEKENAYVIGFYEVAFGTDVEMEKVLKDFLASGKKRLILDLRDNPGGSMTETQSILNFFIGGNKEPLFILNFPDTTSTAIAYNKPLTDWNKYEIVILINDGTASAAEIMTMTLSEYFPKNSIVIGETSYGKGTVQELMGFQDNSLFKFTIAQWVSPLTKTSINKVGIVPDIIVPFDYALWKQQKIDSQMKAAEEYKF